MESKGKRAAESENPPSVPLIPAGPCPTCKVVNETDVAHCPMCGWDSLGRDSGRPRGVGWDLPKWMREGFEKTR